MTDSRLTSGQFRVLLDLCMVSDPWPLTDEDREEFDGLLRQESERRGYDGWVDAYHEFDPSIPDPNAGVPLADSFLEVVAHDADEGVVNVEFHTGKTVQYVDLPPGVVEEWLDAGSASAYYQKNIRGEYRYVVLAH